MAKDFAPWSAETAQGIKTDPVDSNIDVKQQVVPALSVGTINAKTGEWTGIIESDTAFLIDATHEAVGNGAAVLSPQAQPDRIDMTGYNDLFIAYERRRRWQLGYCTGPKLLSCFFSSWQHKLFKIY